MTDRIVLITGASSGIGRATALALAAQNDTLVLVSRSEQSLDEVAAECLERGAADVLIAPTDVGDREAVDATVEASVEEFGRIDAVVHAAAVIAYGRFEQVPADVFDAVVRTNVTGTANVARATLDVFRAQRSGRMVVVGSLLGKIVAPYMASYATSKWAVHGLVRTLQVEARSIPGVDVTLVSPGGVNTPIYTQAGSYTGVVGRPPPPIDSPEKVAAAIIEALDRPRREVWVGLANPVVVLGFRMMAPLFDALVTPLMRLAGQSRTAVEPNPGNVLEPNPDGEDLHGDWPHRI